MKLSASLSVSTTTGPERTPYWRIARKPPSGRRWAKKWVTESVIRKFSSERTRGGWLLASDRAHTSSGTTRKENSRIEKISEISTKNVKEHNVDRYSEEQASGHHSRVQILSFCFPFAFSHSHRGSCGELVLGGGARGSIAGRQSSIVDRRSASIGVRVCRINENTRAASSMKRDYSPPNSNSEASPLCFPRPQVVCF